MRKIIVLSHISMDGVIQGPGGPEEDPSGGFTLGGWLGHFSDDVVGAALRRQMNLPFDLLLGRKTFDIWEPYWPQHPDVWPGAMTATKFVASYAPTASPWQRTVFLSGDLAPQIQAIKAQPGPDIHVWGSGQLMQTLLRHDLVDAYWLKIYPLTLGRGKQMFAEGTLPARFKVTESQVSPEGVILISYERAGAVTPRPG